ncbi:extracellular solute-binding protein [Rugosimonospora africana]|uniref:Sugar ABC transporter substrate-binding protein n=1 Tax=Rugosimonospora africana TaxID=556532 RepID=A0A8J3QT77_9ACTN|nr:extracellular solute-binding protein [Rugosimonospora africana]GIH15577.1 sugar ABC transporter substrate-binding protein [Rugosimonospora africana]
MRGRIAIAPVLCGALLAAAACSGGGTKPATEDKNTSGAITVWLQTDAQTLWPQAVTDATAEFNKTYPKVKVNVVYQAWTDHLTKFDAAAQARTAPDVLEFGNSETAQYIVAGALTDLTADKSTFENSSSWLDGLIQSCTMDGKLYCVPYYGGDRAVTYRKDIFTAAGISQPPKTWPELLTDVRTIATKHASDPNFSAFYMPGSYPYGGLPFVYDAGSQIATQSSDGKWQANLSSAEAQKGLANWKELIDAGYRGDRTKTNLNSYVQLVSGEAAMFYDSSGQMAAVYGAKGNPALKDKLGTFPLPSPTNAGQPVPPFMGGSDLAVPKSAPHPAWSKAWIKAFTSSSAENEFVAGGFLANSKNITSDDPLRSAFSAELAHTWFVPLAKNWAQVEKDQIINQLLVDVATGKSIPDATKTADAAIEKDLNQS